MIRRVLASTLLVSVATSFATGCLPTVLPPPAQPQPMMPPLAAVVGPPLAGQGQIAIDADEPAVVEAITGHSEGYTAGGHFVTGLNFVTVCPQTPCVANLPLGPQDLRLTSIANGDHGGTGSVVISAQPTDYRFALGHNTMPTVGGGIISLTFGMIGLICAPVFIGIGDSGGLGPDLTNVGYASLIGGVVLTGLAVYLLHDSGGTSQNGTGLQWAPGMSGMSGMSGPP